MCMKRLKRASFVIILTVICLNSSISALSSDITDDLFSEMFARAEAIVNYEWIPTQDIEVWNENPSNGKMYFPAGESVIGMPYTLFSWEFGFDSLLSLEQFKRKETSNYSTTAYCSSVSATRTGPVYGSCCATFVSEVLGGSFMSEGNPRYDNCTDIENSKYGTTTYNVKMSDFQPGDAIINTSRGHIMWVGATDSNSVTIYEQTPPVARRVVVSKTSITSEGYMSYRGNIYNIVTKSNELIGSNDDQFDRSNKYSLPIKAYTINTGKTYVYDSINGNTKANKIYDTDLCTITKLYENGWCYVLFPLDAGGTDSGYVRTSVFFPFENEVNAVRSLIQITTYARSTLNSYADHISADDSVFILNQTDHAVQVLYTYSAGGFRIGWISLDSLSDLESSYVAGDINGDGNVNNKDLTRLMKYLAGEDVEIVAEALDTNGDGNVNNKDLTRLMKYLAGENVEIKFQERGEQITLM